MAANKIYRDLLFRIRICLYFVFVYISVLSSTQEFACTFIYGTPTIFVDILNHPDLIKYDFSSVTSGAMGGSTCPPQLIQNVTKVLKNIDIRVAFGLTEGTTCISLTSQDDVSHNVGVTVGKAFEHIESKVVDDKDNIVVVDTTGELLIRGYSTMLGYWDDDEKNREIFTQDHWLRTGDLVSMDENGQIKFVARRKEMIIRGGENIYPKEIEDFLNTHPNIVEAQVFGVPEERLGEMVCAWVLLKPKVKMTTEELISYCNGQIAYFKIPEYIRFVDEIPKTQTGKPKKITMRELTIKSL